MRVIFDRSAFHGERFVVLKNSPLAVIAGRNRVQVFHTPVFLEETASTAGSPGGSDEWKRHLSFALDICNGGIFEDKMDIWHGELVEGRGLHARHLIPERASRRTGSRPRLIRRLRDGMVTGEIKTLWEEVATERDDSYFKKIRQRQIGTDIRRDVAKALKSMPKGKRAEASFKHFRNAELLRAGVHLMSLVDGPHHAALASQWARNPTSYPFYSAFVEGLLYAHWYAAVEHNKPIDGNAQADYEQLAYLCWAEVFVSNDAKFQLDAFNELWRPRGKRFETAESFAALMSRLA
jgi:hypothetical protein